MDKIFAAIWRSLLVDMAYAGALALTSVIFSRRRDAQSLVWSFAGDVIPLYLTLLDASPARWRFTSRTIHYTGMVAARLLGQPE